MTHSPRANETLDECTHIVVIGAGGHGRSVADALALQYPGKIRGLVDDDATRAGTVIIGLPVLGNREWLWEQIKQEPLAVVIGVGNSSVRRQVFDDCLRHGVPILNVIHPTAVVSPTAILGPGTVVLARAIIGANARLGRGVIVGMGSIIEHDLEIGDFTLIGPKVVTGGAAKIGANALIGLNAQLLPGVVVGQGTTVGAGSIVSRNLPDNVIALGVPARIRRKIQAHDQPEFPDDLTQNAIQPATSNRIYLSPPHLSGREQDYLSDALATNWVAPVGPHIDAFEREFADVVGMKFAVAVSSGTAAMHLAIRQLNLVPGDEVFCSTLTFAATVNPVLYERGTPVFIDSEPESWNIDVQLLEEELKRVARKGRLPKAVIAVDLYGQCADWDRLREVCAAYEIPLIEDAAEALGATYQGRPAGSFGWANIFSFNGNKIITTSGGGMLTTNDESFAKSAMHLATQARDPAPHYEHSTVGYNYRMSNLLAGVGRAQLAVLNDRVASRRAVFEYYHQQLAHVPGIEFMPEAAFGMCTRWLTCMLIDPEEFGATASDIQEHLAAHDIESRPAWKPMHCQPVFAGYRAVGGKVAENIFRHGLCLPSGSSLSRIELERVVSTFLSVPRCKQITTSVSTSIVNVS